MAQCDKERKLAWNSLQRYGPRQVAVFEFAETSPGWSFVSVTVISLIGTKLHLRLQVFPASQLWLLRVLPRREVEQLNHFEPRSDQLTVINHFTGVNTANSVQLLSGLFVILIYGRREGRLARELDVTFPGFKICNPRLPSVKCQVQIKAIKGKMPSPALMLRIL